MTTNTDARLTDDGAQPVIAPALSIWQRALEVAEAALADIGDSDRNPGDDVNWCEKRAAQALPTVRAAIATPQPVIAPELKPSGQGARTTELKTKSILEGGVYQITGYVLSNEDGKRAIIDMGAVRWIEKDAMWNLMHGPNNQPGIAPEWVMLTDADIYEMYVEPISDSEMIAFARRIQAAFIAKQGGAA